MTCWDFIMNFYNTVWHPYWTAIDLGITFFVLYQLRRLHFLVKDFNKIIKKDKPND